MQLKISSITNLTDARFFSAIGAHYLGFNFDVLNENNISLQKAKEIINWLHAPVIVGEFGIHQSKEEIEFIAKEMELNEIQIPITHQQKSTLAFDKFLFVDEFPIAESQFSTDFFILKINENDIHHPKLKSFIAHNNVFIDTHFTKENSLPIIETLQPYGIQFTCQKEEKIGFSRVDEYAEILEIIGLS